MPKIPVMEGIRKESVGTEMPTVSINNAGIVAGALSNFGGQAAELGMEIYKRRQKEELNNWTSKNYYDYRREVQQQELALKDKYSNTDFKGYAQEYDSMLTKTREKYLQGADSDAKKLRFNDAIGEFVSSNLVKADMYEHSENANYYDRAKFQQIENTGGDGDYINANKTFKDLALEIAHSERSTPEKREAFEKQMGTSAYRTIQAMIQLKNTRGAIAVLDGKDPKNSDEILKRLTPFEKTQLRVQAVNSEMTLKNEMFKSVHNNLKNAEAALSTGELSPDDPLIAQTKAQIEMLPEEDRLALRQGFAVVEATAQMASAFSMIPPQERDIEGLAASKMEDLKTADPLAKAAVAGTIKQKAAAINDNLNAKFQKDPVAYYSQRDPLLADLSVAAVQGSPQIYEQYKTKLDANYDRWGVPTINRKYASPAMKKHFGEGIKKAFNDKPNGAEDMALKLFTDFESMAGNDSFALLKELKLPETYAVIGEISDPALRKNAIKNIMFPISDADYKLKFSDSDHAPNIEKQELIATGSNLYTAYASIANDQSSFKNAQAILDTTHKEYRRLRMSGMDASDARIQAWKMFDESFSVIESNKSAVLIPKNIENTNNIENFMEDYLKTKTDAFTQGSHKWVSSPNRDGMMLLAPSHDNPAYFKPLTDDNGQPLVFKFDDINQVAYPPRKAWIDAQKEASRYRRMRTTTSGKTGYDYLNQQR